MQEHIYAGMVEAIGRRGGGLPSIRCKEFDALIDDLFTEDEAGFFLQMPDDPFLADTMARITGMDPVHAEKLLEEMTEKGLLIAMDKDSKRTYITMSLLPGLYEFHFHKFHVGERARKSARIFSDYRDAVEKIETATPGIYPTVPWARVIPLNQDIQSNIQIQTFDQVQQYIDRAKNIAVADCYCRIMGELLDNPCQKPMEVCLAFGPGAVNMAERGFARIISKEEAFQILEKADEAGLVHCSSNTSRYIDFICNCCTCHCYILRTVKKSSIPSFAASSSVMASVDAENCIGCEACLERCPMDALKSKDDVVEVDDNRCIGCGLCIRACPADAIVLISRPGGMAPPFDMKNLNKSIIASKKARI